MPVPVAAPSALRRLLGAVDGGRVLDVATGTGGFIPVLASALRSHSGFTGVDTDPDSIAEARRQVSEASFEIADAARLPFPDAGFDTVATANSLHHLPDPDAALAEMLRVLRPGGAFIVREMYRDRQTGAQLTHILAHDWWAEVNTRLGESHRPSYTRAAVIELIAGIGLEQMVTDDLVPENEDRFDPDALEEFAGRNRRVLERLGVASDYAAQELRCEQLVTLSRRTGILRPSAVITLGRKPA